MKTSSFATVTEAVYECITQLCPIGAAVILSLCSNDCTSGFIFICTTAMRPFPCVPGASLYSNLTYRALLLVTISANLLESTAQIMFSS